jgi:two-component system response regulator NreC
VLVDDHRLFRDGLRSIFQSQSDLEVVGEAADAREAYQVVETSRPDVIIVDIVLPGTNGVAVTRELTRQDRSRKILILTMSSEEEFVAQALHAGATGYALKHQGQNELLEAVRCVGSGKSYLSPRVSSMVVASHRHDGARAPGSRPLAMLSPREQEVFDLLVRGYSNEGIAGHLCISVKTVETHRAHVLRKIGVHSLVDLVRFAARHHLLVDADRGAP